MIEGHGDDTYRYEGIRANFSSNICQHTDLSALKAHLTSRLDLIANYPEPEAWTLEKLIAEKLGIPARCVVVTNGATDAIYLIAQTFPFDYKILGPTFSEYEDACKMFFGNPYLHSLWLCNPNNPNGYYYSEDDIMLFSRNFDKVVVDQSYECYTDKPVLDAQTAVGMKNVILIHSMTKTYGVPGLRLGYITANASLTALLRQQMRPWAVNALAIEAGKFLMANGQALRPDLKEAQRLRGQLHALKGISVDETCTNFMLCKIDGSTAVPAGFPANHTASRLKEYLVCEHKMLIRDASNFNGLTPFHFRIAAQTPAENDALVAAIQQFLSNISHRNHRIK